MKKSIRFLVYLVGLMLLALGIVMNARTDLGVSSISSVPFSLSELTELSPGICTIGMYFVCVLLQVLLLGRRCSWSVLLQLPFSMLFGSFIDLFNGPFNYHASSPAMQALMLACAVTLTALGATLVAMMNIVPNAPDGLARLMGEKFKKDFGFGKNLLDGCCIIATVALTLIMSGRVFGVGLGTLISALAVGRLISRFQRILKPLLETIGAGDAKDAAARIPTQEVYSE